jgi:hypothetical protein
MFFEDTAMVETPADEYTQGDYQNAFTVEVEVSRQPTNNNSEQPSIPVYEIEEGKNFIDLGELFCSLEPGK